MSPRKLALIIASFYLVNWSSAAVVISNPSVTYTQRSGPNSEGPKTSTVDFNDFITYTQEIPFNGSSYRSYTMITGTSRAYFGPGNDIGFVPPVISPYYQFKVGGQVGLSQLNLGPMPVSGDLVADYSFTVAGGNAQLFYYQVTQTGNGTGTFNGGIEVFRNSAPFHSEDLAGFPDEQMPGFAPDRISLIPGSYVIRMTYSIEQLVSDDLGYSTGINALVAVPEVSPTIMLSFAALVSLTLMRTLRRQKSS